jgi:hypothetical protein
MIKIKVDGVEDIVRKLTHSPRQIEIATQRALLKTANEVKNAEIEHMKHVFDRPTRWTLGAIKVKATSKMEVQVGVIDPDGYYKRAANYLNTQIAGGSRHHKAMENALQKYGLMPPGWFAIPGEGAKFDSYGNISAGQIRQILSWFDAAERWAGSTQNMGVAGRAKRRKGTRNTVGFEYVDILPGGKGNLKQPGIYQRFFFGSGKSIKPILIFVNKVNYKPIFRFEEIARKIITETFAPALDSALDQDFMK